MRLTIVLLVYLFWPNALFAQVDAPAHVSAGVFTQDTNVRAVLDLWQHYLASRPDSTYANPYWDSNEQRKYPNFDLAAHEFTANLYVMMESFRPTVLSITRASPDLYRIRTLYSAQDSGYADPLAIVDVFAQKQGSEWKLRNALLVNTEHWQHKRIGHINFIFPSTHKFNAARARKLSDVADTLAHVLGIPPIDVDYYFSDTRIELLRALGYYFQLGEYEGAAPSGKSDYENRVMYGAGLGEYYPHELTHIYVTPHLEGIGFLLDEGIATFVGGSRGMSLGALVRRADSLLAQRPEFNVDSLMEPVNLDEVTNAVYVSGGLLIQMAYDRWGWKGTIDLLRSIHDEESWNAAVSKILGVPRPQFGEALRNEIHRRAILR